MSRQAIYNDKAQKATFAGRVERPNPLIGALYLHARIACLDDSNVVFRFEHGFKGFLIRSHISWG